MNEKEQIIQLIEKEFAVINDSQNREKAKIKDEDIYILLKDLNSLIKMLYNVDFIEAGKKCRKYFIPSVQNAIAKDTNEKRKVEYMSILENAYRISARTNFEDFVRYYEWNETDKFFEPRYPILRAYAFYLNRMVFDPNFNLLIVNLPSGTGKTYLEKLYEAFSYGVDPTGTCLYICSNEDVVTGRK